MARFQDDENFYFDQYKKIHLLLEILSCDENKFKFKSFSFPKERKLMYVFSENWAEENQ